MRGAVNLVAGLSASIAAFFPAVSAAQGPAPAPSALYTASDFPSLAHGVDPGFTGEASVSVWAPSSDGWKSSADRSSPRGDEAEVDHEVVEALAGFRDSFRDRVTLETRYTVRQVVAVEPPPLTPADVRGIRESLGLSQTVFADFLVRPSPAIPDARAGLSPSSGSSRSLGQCPLDLLVDFLLGRVLHWFWRLRMKCWDRLVIMAAVSLR